MYTLQLISIIALDTHTKQAVRCGDDAVSRTRQAACATISTVDYVSANLTGIYIKGENYRFSNNLIIIMLINPNMSFIIKNFSDKMKGI